MTEDVIAERYRVILSLRFLSTKLLLHRPIFVKSLRAMPMASSMRSMGEMRRRSNTAAVRAAEEIVALVHQVLSQGDTGRRLLGAWWFTLWYGKLMSNARLHSRSVWIERLVVFANCSLL